MNEFAAKLVTLDRDAQSVLDDAGQYRRRLREDTQAQKERILAEYEEQARKHLDEVRETEAQAAREQCDKTRERYRQLSRELEQTYLREHQGWEDELFRRCSE